MPVDFYQTTLRHIPATAVRTLNVALNIVQFCPENLELQTEVLVSVSLSKYYTPLRRLCYAIYFFHHGGRWLSHPSFQFGQCRSPRGYKWTREPWLHYSRAEVEQKYSREVVVCWLKWQVIPKCSDMRQHLQVLSTGVILRILIVFTNQTGVVLCYEYNINK